MTKQIVSLLAMVGALGACSNKSSSDAATKVTNSEPNASTQIIVPASSLSLECRYVTCMFGECQRQDTKPAQTVSLKLSTQDLHANEKMGTQANGQRMEYYLLEDVMNHYEQRTREYIGSEQFNQTVVKTWEINSLVQGKVAKMDVRFESGFDHDVSYIDNSELYECSIQK